MGLLEFLRFDDWISEREFENQAWITVACITKQQNTYLNTISVLIKLETDEIYEKILSDSEWVSRFDFGTPYFYLDENNQERVNILGTEFINGMELEPFILYKEFHGLIPSKFELVQNFINFYNLYFVKGESLYKTLDKDGEEYNVVQIIENRDQMQIKINTKCLRNYLGAKEMILLRQHDHRRFSYQSFILENENNKSLEFNFTESLKFSYTIYINNREDISDILSGSRLLGKDIIKPYQRVNYSIIWFSDKFWGPKNQFCKFIIDLDENGNIIEEICNEKELSNFFVNRGKAHFLTPVFFKRGVLKKYYDNPSKYTTTAQGIRCLDLWYLPIDENEKSLVYAWLGDLGRIPYKEQQHFRQYNIPPEGSVTKHRISTDFLAEPMDPIEPVFNFRKAYYRANEHFQKSFGFNLFKEISKSDSYCYISLHIPTTNEQKEFDEMILNLAKVLNEPLNKLSLDNSVDTSINALENFLNSKIDSQEVSDIIKPFKIVQSLRSSGAAHLKGKNYLKNISRAGLNELSNQNKFTVLLKDVTQSLEKLAKI